MNAKSSSSREKAQEEGGKEESIAPLEIDCAAPEELLPAAAGKSNSNDNKEELPSPSDLYALPVCRLIIVLIFLLICPPPTPMFLEQHWIFFLIWGGILLLFVVLVAPRVVRGCESRNCCAYLDHEDIEALASMTH